jgi:murein DD-endopeptidase MepM/ murein hydrolase activator NlpD
MALPAALGAALSKFRTLHGLAGLASGASSRKQGGRRCCVISCAGCGACACMAGAVLLAAGGALVAVTASLAGIGGGDQGSCLSTTAASSCAALADSVVGAPMTCAGLYASQGFGDTPWEHPHTGIDIVCPPATLVVAVRAGTFHQEHGAPVPCAFPSGRTGGLGTYGELISGDLTFLYGHLEGFAAGNDVQVVAGQPLGFEGESGCATGYHLHFEVVTRDAPIDPCPLLPAGYPSQHDPIGQRCWGSAPP